MLLLFIHLVGRDKFFQVHSSIQQNTPGQGTNPHHFVMSPPCQKTILGILSKPRRRRQRERHQTKGFKLMSKTIDVHVRHKSLYILMPSYAKQHREMTKFCVVYRTWTTTANFSYFHLELNAVVAY